MRTYSKLKRHNRTAKQNALNIVADQTSRKRVLCLEPEVRQTKRSKLVDRPTMFGTFETPHPTLEASSQIYKLPSTKPMPSPTPFSPVPGRPKDLRTRPNIPTTSGDLKENPGIKKRTRQRQSSKTPSSFPLPSESKPTSRKNRENGKQPRSPSASSSSRSRDRRSKSRSKLIKKHTFKPNSLSERRFSNSKEFSFMKSKSLGRSHKSSLLISTGERDGLGSPFASRAPSPIERYNSNISNHRIANSMGPPVAEPDFPNKEGRLSDVFDAFSSPEKRGERRLSSRSTNGGTAGTNRNAFSWKNRRPSAPSNLQRPPKPVSKAYIPEKMPRKIQVKEDKENLHTNNFQKLMLSCPFDPFKDWDDDWIQNPDPFSWMQARSAVNFNRPPSQMSFHLPSGLNHAEGDVEAEGVFWSSGEDDDDQLNQQLLEAGKSRWLTSSPYKNVIARRPSVPILEGSSKALADTRCFGKVRSMSLSTGKSGLSTALRHDDKIDQDMELTAPLECGDEIYQKDSRFLEEHTPWITDSIISPPTAYSKEKRAVVEERVEEEQTIPAELSVPTDPSPPVPTQSRIFNSPFRPSHTLAAESPTVDLLKLATSGDQKSEVAIADDKGASSVRDPSQRTRSGTILAPKNGALNTRRTRTGTIVGPSAFGRTRSGTIVPTVKVPEQNEVLGGNRRIRSGSPTPDISVSGKVTRSRTGSVTNLGPIKLSDGTGSEERKAGNNLAQIGKMCTDDNFESAIQEVNEADCYVDSSYLTSSPDPINFLTGAKIDGDESGLVVAVGEWRVAEPPSPEIRKRKKTVRTPRSVGSNIRRFKLKGKRRNFLQTDGMSDDELLLVDGQSQSLFN